MTAEYLRGVYKYVKYTGECRRLIRYAAWQYGCPTHTHNETYGFVAVACRGEVVRGLQHCPLATVGTLEKKCWRVCVSACV